MDVSKPGEDGLQVQASWIPTTPVKPILPRPQPIYTDGQGNQLDQATWLGSETYSSSFPQGSQGTKIVACCNSPNSSEANRDGDNVEACEEPMARWNNLRFGDLLALADAASAASGIGAAQGSDSFWNRDLSLDSLDSELGANGNSIPEQPQDVRTSHQQSYDLNLPLETVSTISQLVPITPEKDTRVQNKPVSEVQNVYANERIDHEREKRENEVAAVTVDSNEVQCNKELSMPVTDSSFGDVSTLFKENHNLDKGGSHGTDLNETPQQKPKRKKHRPKVISEGKPKRTPKLVTPKPTGSKENPTVERKNVRRKRINISSPTPPAELTGESTDLTATPPPELTSESTDPETLEPAKKSCRRASKFEIGQPQDEISTSSKEKVKRKYVRRKGINKPAATPVELTGESTDLKTFEPARKSCRRALNFDIEQPQDERSTCKFSINLDSELQAQDFCRKGVKSGSTVQLGEGIEVLVEHIEAGIPYDIACSMNQMLKEDISLPGRQVPSKPLLTKTNPPQAELNADSQKDSTKKGEGQLIAHNGQENIAKTNNQISPSPNDSNCSTGAILTEGDKATQSKRRYSHAAEHADASIPNLVGAYFSTLEAYQAMNWIHFPNINKKKRTEKGQNSTTSSASSCITTTKYVERTATCLQHDAETIPCSSKSSQQVLGPPQFDAGMVSLEVEDKERGLQKNHQSFEHILALIQKDRSTRKRSRGPTRVRDSTSLTRLLECITHPTKPPLVVHDGQTVENPHKPHTCIDDLVAKTSATPAKKKRTKKRNSFVTSASSKTNEMQQDQELVLYKHRLSSSNPLGASMDALVEEFKHLDFNRESRKLAREQHNAVVPYSMQKQEQNALVIYKKDGVVVPYKGLFDPTKKRRPRPKVNLDEETNRVWKLLLENINSEGIDGTDEDKVKWWEEERRVFRGRADSFIARMHLVQGDRRFSQWKGSVVDSVVGVFLTQNVSDHLSSSAFMSLAARFPLKSGSNNKECYEDGASFIVNEPEVCIPDPEDRIQWKPDCDQSSVTLQDLEHNEEKEVVSSNESPGGSRGAETGCYIEEDRIATKDPVSSQNSAFLSRNSSFIQTAEKIGSCLQRNLEAKYLLDGSKPDSSNGFASIVELRQMAGSTMLNAVYSHGSSKAPSDENSKGACIRSKGMNHDNQRQYPDRLKDPQSSLAASMSPSSDYHLHLTPTSRVLEVEHSEMFREEIQYPDSSKSKDENTISKQSELTIESSSQAAVLNKLTMNVEISLSSESCNNIQGYENMINSPQSQAPGDPEIVGPVAQGQNIEMRQNLQNLSGETLDATQTTAESDLNALGHLFSMEISEMNAATVKAKSKRVRKEKKDEISWDNLRKQVETNGKKRERAANTMDSLDWEAVRSADVNEIADSIRERGMNNKLAERIKDFLNRLVRDHGSIDLEWLRDVPPDQAKEYLLSVRGLGLKSVECVRLLTLHQLAFPVDTNVGRIAVRLGWVPLQPLPESLQLHLLELYPVLESIQKYLWPRLCKLDQRTLYELHYQMITFGKVFCTKSKPNCNSCPMRGECRHFASAFASARLALPGPEEKSIVTATDNKPDKNPNVIINRLSLPFLQSQSEAKSGVTNCEPIIEEPATPEPECKEVENDIEDTFYEDPDEIPVIKLNIEEFTQNLHTYMQNNMELQEFDMSKALVALTPEAASIPMPKLKNVSRLRTEHQVYELPDSHPLLKGLDKREPDDPCSYLLAIWTPGETANSIQPPEKGCSSQENDKLCDKKDCFSCNSIRETSSQMVRGTLLIPCRTAMKGSFPLNGTYFQVNEVFADHDSSLDPIDVPRDWIWNLPRRTVYFGTSIPTIFKGLSTEGIQHCFWRGYVCVRGFDQKTRAPRPLKARLHFPASKLTRTKEKADDK
ncbi:hypothetical protein FH972_016532 [Carpinus fangiana]|uniref:HhH-GPD domain-containing protein n=1 Tax=Carpinus fangiana TaxID=176857 RepID=A0A5N6RG60_9ROSI|nr:hypothetical protein FH972_016532 [Carpinus fangiana]